MRWEAGLVGVRGLSTGADREKGDCAGVDIGDRRLSTDGGVRLKGETKDLETLYKRGDPLKSHM